MKLFPFNKPYLTGQEEIYILESLQSLHHCGNNAFCEKCISLLKTKYGAKNVFLVPSCTDALEMGCLLYELGPEDEVILPSYTFSSTVNAVVLTGAHPVFCEIEPSTLNIDPTKIEALITDRTRMILPIHYAGIPAEMDTINSLAQKHNLIVFEDAAQALGSVYKGSPAGLLGHIAAFSFHETKNISCGEGGALFVNDDAYVEKAAFIQEKGTDRSRVLQGLQSKYGWVSKGSSFLLSDILAAHLLAQLEHIDDIITKRHTIYEGYRNLFTPYAEKDLVSIPVYPDYIEPNYHAFFVIFRSSQDRGVFLNELKKYNIYPYIGYVPLHSSSMGRKYGYKPEDLPLTEDLAARTVRLLFYTSLDDEDFGFVLEKMQEVMNLIYGM